MADAASDRRTGSESPREDAATKATREELKHTAISEKQHESFSASLDGSDHSTKGREATPEQVMADAKPHDGLKEQVGSPKKKRAHDQVDNDDEEHHKPRPSKDSEQGDDDSNTGRETASSGSVLEAPNGGGDGIASGPAGAAAAAANTTTNRSDRAEPEKKRLRDKEAEAATKSGKANAEATDENGSAHSSTKDSKPVAAASSSAFASSGFAKLTSSVSPFGALGGVGSSASKPSLFGSSSSAASPFGALAPAKAATTTPAPASALASAPKLSFGGASAASPFASLQSSSSNKTSFGSPFGSRSTNSGLGGFGGVGAGAAGGSVFGNALTAGPRLTSFAKPGEVFKSDKPARPFGAPESEAEDDDDDSDDKKDDEADAGANDGDKGGEAEGAEEGGDAKEIEERPKGGAEDKKKPKLQRVTVDDGEAGEATVLQVRSRLYYLDKDQGGWKERGVGMLKLNVPERCVEYDYDGSVIPASFDASTLAVGAEHESREDAEAKSSSKELSSGAVHGTTKAVALPQRSVVRLIMRQDSTHKVILNTVVLALMQFQERQTLKSTTVLFTAFEGEDAKPVNVQARMNAANAKTFLKTMEGIQKELREN